MKERDSKLEAKILAAAKQRQIALLPVVSKTETTVDERINAGLHLLKVQWEKSPEYQQKVEDER